MRVGCNITAQQYASTLWWHALYLPTIRSTTMNFSEYTTRGKFSIILHTIIIVIITQVWLYTAFCFINKIITIIYIINAAGRPGVIGRWLYTIHGVHTPSRNDSLATNENVLTRVCWLASGRIHKLPEQTTRAHTAGSSVCVCVYVKNCD